MKTLLERIQDIVSHKLGVEVERVLPSAKFVDDLDADSLDMVELVMGLEQEFAVNITDEEAEKFITVADVLRCIENQTHA